MAEPRTGYEPDLPEAHARQEDPARPDEQTLLVMILETCAAEATHALLILAGLGLLAIWPGAGGILLYLIYAIFRQSGFSHHSAL